MPVTVKGERLYGGPGVNNSAVLMDIITKLKQDLHKSKTENSKLTDQLNCLIALVKRSWAGDHGASMHLANIVGVPAPNADAARMTTNTPVQKSRAVWNWERMAVRLLEREFVAIQREIHQQQQLFMHDRHQYLDDVLQDHHDEMSRFSHVRQKIPSTVEEVDKRFIRCYSAKVGRGGKKPVTGTRPKSAAIGRQLSVPEMAVKADLHVEDLVGSRPPSQHRPETQDANTAFKGLYKLSASEPVKRYHHNQVFDDSNRYKQNKLFDPDAVFGPQLLTKTSEKKTRAASASTVPDRDRHKGMGPKTTAFLTEPVQDRPLKFETTRPINHKVKPTARMNSAPSSQDRRDNLQRVRRHSDAGQKKEVEHMPEQVIAEPDVMDKPPISVKVKKIDPVDTFVNELKLMEEMQENFKKSAIDLQKKIGIKSGGFVY